MVQRRRLSSFHNFHCYHYCYYWIALLALVGCLVVDAFLSSTTTSQSLSSSSIHGCCTPKTTTTSRVVVSPSKRKHILAAFLNEDKWDVDNNNQGQSNNHDDDDYVITRRNTSRRGFFCDASLSLMSSSSCLFLTMGNPSPTLAAAATTLSQEELDKANIVKGYKRLQYLLDNWEKETTICKIGGDSQEVRCERTPLKVMDYLGYKATDDPLFKAEKTLRRLYVLAPPDRDVDYFEAVERYAENADEASGMAYISSWGEANPGGGKDRVELFIERARKNVVTAYDSLGTVIDILGLKL